jgi:hypothetical protein
MTNVTYNLSSRSGIAEPCDLRDLAGWFNRELRHIPSPAEQSVLTAVAAQLDAFVKWPTRALLLWPGCNRIPEQGKRIKYHSYPDTIKAHASNAKVRLDTRPNGPAIAAFLIAGGTRPARLGSSNAWSIHHLYSGKFPYHRKGETIHAAKEATHFTQSAGLVAAHPVADALVDEFPCFAWLLRGHAYLRHKYDPDSVFGATTNEFGFAEGFFCELLGSPA